jgi:hypothetical protein
MLISIAPFAFSAIANYFVTTFFFMPAFVFVAGVTGAIEALEKQDG